MALPPGTKLGPYEIVSAEGAVGMGEVYCTPNSSAHADNELLVDAWKLNLANSKIVGPASGPFMRSSKSSPSSSPFLLGKILMLALCVFTFAASAFSATGEQVSYRSGDETVSAMLYTPLGKGPFPALIAIHAVGGLDDWVKQQASNLADAGYLTLAVDLYRGRVASGSADKMSEAREIARSVPAGRRERDLQAAFNFLLTRPDAVKDRIGAIGWCMGGSLAIRLASLQPALKVAVAHYPTGVPDDFTTLSKINAPLLLVLGEKDTTFPLESGHRFEQQMKSLGKNVVTVVYQDAGHAFEMPWSSQGYRPEDSADAWKRTIAFLNQTAVDSTAEARFLTADPGATDFWPCFSPDGNTVLFSRTTDGGKTWKLFVVPTSGGEAHRLAELPVSATRANWSSHNNLIAFTGTSSDGSATVWLIKPDGTQPRQLSAPGLSDRVFYPSWYPDGESLAVMDVLDNVIKRIDLRGHAAVTVTSRSQILAGMPSVSPDGQWIAFAGQKNTGQPYDQTRNSIWLVSNTGDLRSLEPTLGQGRTPAWSPDGQSLAFESNRTSPNQLYAVFIINRNGSGLRQVTPYELNANHPTWSADQKHLVFSARHANGKQSSGIAIMDVAKP